MEPFTICDQQLDYMIFLSYVVYLYTIIVTIPCPLIVILVSGNQHTSTYLL